MNYNSELMRKLSDCFSPSGRENNIRELIINEIKGYADEINVDALGNLIVRKKGNGKKILFSAHMDQIGLIITHVDEKGFLRFSNVGGISAKEILGLRMIFDNGLEGVVCSEEIKDKEKITMNKLFLDVASTSKDFVKNNFKTGDMCVFKSEYYETDDCVICRAADDRIGCYILIEALKNHPSTDNDVYYVFSVQEEVGCRGAKTAAYQINPDLAIAVDVTDTGDTDNGTKMDVKLGEGAAIKIMDKYIITHPEIKNLLTDLAIEKNIKYQYEVLEHGGTDAGPIHLSREGVPSGAISIPTRNIHTSGEIFSKSDVLECIKLVIEVIKK
ncbi:M42 family metallopeptidase [Sedimentibacter hydroxybenzoicus DSM 7310]|uniref:M42 family metallopeptidase n=1 Tax=Sedimentibacter hydroxybenzoicus DSM 7310 TaxID=1123245 RepID=A0A974GVQ1_SEDHY|nr:M42 family metallopeptidase [Sedimentibacter hydroxybenzoicus]NYB73551.1 M42 family metallopeptidase [Sedimentibacter hydroxybenzoicus DSM 7310]